MCLVYCCCRVSQLSNIIINADDIRRTYCSGGFMSSVRANSFPGDYVQYFLCPRSDFMLGRYVVFFTVLSGESA